MEPSREFKDGMAVLRMCGNVSRLLYLEAMNHMADKYPERGWERASSELEDWYAKHDKSLTAKHTEGMGGFSSSVGAKQKSSEKDSKLRLARNRGVDKEGFGGRGSS